MKRSKNTDSGRPPKPVGSWLAGMVIGTAIMSMATGAAMLGVSLAIRDSSVKGG